LKQTPKRGESKQLNGRAVYELLRDSIFGLFEGDTVSRGAALSFYTFFAIAPLFVIVLAIGGLAFGREAAQLKLFSQVTGLVGAEGGEAIQALVSASHKPQSGFWGTVVAAATLFLAATGVFVELQDSLNSVWGVRRAPGRGLRSLIKDRLLSFALLVGVGFLLLISLVLSAGLAALSQFMSALLPSQEIVLEGVHFVISFGVITLLFAMIFKVLPDVKIPWRDVWIGAILTAFLFNFGKLLLGLYLGRGSVVSAYGAAGSLVIVLWWVYYSVQILFFGAKVTQIYSDRYGSHPAALPGAEAVTIKAVVSDLRPATEQHL
jgi:membrane protein